MVTAVSRGVGTSPCLVPPNASVPGPCDPEDLLDGVIFGAKYLGSTQLVSERNPPTSVRMAQAQEAVDRIKVRGGRETQLPPAQPLLGVGTFPKGPWGCGAGTRGVLAGAVTSPGHVLLQAPEGESQPMTEVDLFVSTQRIKVLTADTQVSREHGHPRGSGAARTVLFGPGISAGAPASGAVRRDGLRARTRLGGDASLRSHPRGRAVSLGSARLHQASRANCSLRELPGSQTKLQRTYT